MRELRNIGREENKLPVNHSPKPNCFVLITIKTINLELIQVHNPPWLDPPHEITALGLPFTIYNSNGQTVQNDNYHSFIIYLFSFPFPNRFHLLIQAS